LSLERDSRDFINSLNFSLQRLKALKRKIHMPIQNLFAEKRAHERVPLKMPVRYRVLEENYSARNLNELSKNENQSQTLDTSLGGLCVAQDGRLITGNILNLKLLLPGRDEIITAFADVVWATQTLAGLHFLAVKEKDLELLSQQLKRIQVA
jgi:PilZ domain